MKLTVIKKNKIEKIIDLSKEIEGVDKAQTIFIVGRSPNALIHLDDKQISREHAKLIHDHGIWILENISDKEIFINSEPVIKKELKSGDVIHVGTIEIEIEIPQIDIRESPANQFEFSRPQIEITGEIKKTEEGSSGGNYDFELDSQNLKENLEEEKALSSSVAVGKQKPTEVDTRQSTNENPADDLGVSDLEGGDKVSLTSAESIHEEQVSENEFQDDFMNDDLDLNPIAGEVQESTSVTNNSLKGIEESGLVVTSDDQNYSLDNIDESNADGTKVMQSFAVIELALFGEHAPYDRFFLENGDTFIGRDSKKCKIVLNDTEVSGVHAVIRRNNMVCVLEDLGSSNGTIVNGERINKITINNGDEFLIGTVSFTVKVKSDFLKQENQMLMPIDFNETVEVEEVVEVPLAENESLDAFGQEIQKGPPEKSIIKRIWKDEQQRKKLIYGVVILVGLWFMLDEDKPKNSVKKDTAIKEKEGKKETEKGSVTVKKLSPEEMERLSRYYQFGRSHFTNGRYREAIEEFNKVVAVDPNFNDSIQSQLALAKDGLKRIEDLEREKQKKLDEAARKEKVEELLKNAREYVKDRRIEMADAAFNEIAMLDPDNIEVPRLKQDLESWKKEQARKELEEAQKKAERQAKVQKLQPGKSFYGQKEWFKAIAELEKFMKVEDMDDDLRKEGEEMLATSKNELASGVNPLIGKARSLVEGQDLKGAYETYMQVLKLDPSNVESLNQTTDIKDQLTNKARKIFREAIISESLSLFQDAKEKFQEVQQISPVDSEYYKKATDKLKNYLD